MGYSVFTYVFEGSGSFDPSNTKKVGERRLISFSDGDGVRVKAFSEQLRFLFLTGKPLREPVAWGGPIVMNTDQELEITFEEYRNGTFIKPKR